MARNRMIAAVILLLVTAHQVQSQVRDRDFTWIAPSRAATKINPLADHPEAERGGAKLFADRCAMCHGDNGRGTNKAPDLTVADVQAQADGALFWKISTGNSHAGMPSFSFLPEAQRWQLVLRVRSLAGQSTAGSSH